MTQQRNPCGCGGVSTSQGRNTGGDGGINRPCHGGRVGVITSKGHVTPNPKIVLIYWDQYSSDTPGSVTMMNQFVTDLTTGDYWQALGQYGVGAASFEGYFVIDMKKYPTPNSVTAGTVVNEDQLQNQLIQWLDDGLVTPAPAGDEVNLVYLIFAPSDTTLSAQTPQGPVTTGFCGYHSSGKHNASDDRDNLLWGVVHNYSKSLLYKAFVDSISPCVTHELTESFTDPDGNGWISVKTPPMAQRSGFRGKRGLLNNVFYWRQPMVAGKSIRRTHRVDASQPGAVR
jgi:hypothetical protein